ncbi:MAG: hypothetical protein G01um1014106_157 [Parcubacteria group bacterium Gr01-1014_106]|nr:MAG: hypothetical protein G01um1014106_157 [Parcubacteria group bacterium Gr01-1014_106]
MPAESKTESFPLDTLLYLWTSPATADFGLISPEEFGDRVASAKLLPENLRRALTDEESARKIQILTLRKHQLSIEEAQSVARIVGKILRGDESAANLRTLLQQQIQTSDTILDNVTQEVTKGFVTPNYFQIAQVYEKKHPTSPRQAAGLRGAGREQGAETRYEATGNRKQETGTTQSADGIRQPRMDTERPSVAPPAVTPMPPRAAPFDTAQGKPPRVIDLRNGGVPSRLPPPATPLPRTKDNVPTPPTHPSAPPVPPGVPLERLTPPSSPK